MKKAKVDIAKIGNEFDVSVMSDSGHKVYEMDLDGNDAAKELSKIFDDFVGFSIDSVEFKEGIWDSTIINLSKSGDEDGN